MHQSVTHFLETLVNEVFICDAIRTPFGRYGGALASIRTDDLAAIPLRGLIERDVYKRQVYLKLFVGARFERQYTRNRG